jgi:hypothetical protein
MKCLILCLIPLISIIFFGRLSAQDADRTKAEQEKREQITKYQKLVDSLSRTLEDKRDELRNMKDVFRYSGGWFSDRVNLRYISDSMKTMRAVVNVLRKDSIQYVRISDSLSRFTQSSSTFIEKTSALRVEKRRLETELKSLDASLYQMEKTLRDTAVLRGRKSAITPKSSFDCVRNFDSFRKANPRIANLEAIIRLQYRDEMDTILSVLRREPYGLSSQDIFEVEARLDNVLGQYGFSKGDGLFMEESFRLANAKNYVVFMDKCRIYLSNPYKGLERRRLVELRAIVLDQNTGACLSKSATDTLDYYYNLINTFCRATEVLSKEYLSGFSKKHINRKFSFETVIAESEIDFVTDYPYLMSVLKGFVDDYIRRPDDQVIQKYKDILVFKYDKDCLSFMQ